MELKCTRKDCNHVWNYTGKKHYPAMVQCPNCANKIRVTKVEP